MINRSEQSAINRSITQLASCIACISRMAGIVAVLALLVIVNIEVIGRSVFDEATIWVTEVSSYLVVAITFLSAAYTVFKESNIRVDLLLNRFGETTQRELQIALNWLSAFIVLVVLWKFSAFWQENFRADIRSWSLLNTPVWIPQLSVLIGLIAMLGILCGNLSKQVGHLALLPVLLALVVLLCDSFNLYRWSLTSTQGLLLCALMLAFSAALSKWRVARITWGAMLGLMVIFWGASEKALAIQSIVLIAVLLLLLFIGLPVVFSLFSVAVLVMSFWLPGVSLNAIGERTWGAVNTFELAAIPMFVLMGVILVRSNASSEMFTAARLNMGRVPGSLAYAAITASGIFAAVSGSSLATAATMGRVAGPEMIDQGYKPTLTYGVLAAGGTLGILIPPSIAMIIYGPMAGVAVTELFMAGIIPGLLMIVAFALVVFVWSLIDRRAVPSSSPVPIIEKLCSLVGVLPFLALMLTVLGSLYAGIATPTEAGAVGALGALAISLLRRTLSVKSLIVALEEAAITTSFLLIIAVAAAVMSFGIDFLAMPQALVGYVDSLDLSDFGLFFAIVILYLVLGMFVEPISMILMTLPIILPVISAAGWDPLWFGIILVMLVEIGLITPPVGMILYVLAGVAGAKVKFSHISLGVLPFVGAFLGMIWLFFGFPSLVTWLPELLR